MPDLLAYVQDRDLWKFELPNSREISAYIYSKGYNFQTWSEMHLILETYPQRAKAVEIGEAVLQVQEYQLEALTNPPPASRTSEATKYPPSTHPSCRAKSAKGSWNYTRTHRSSAYTMRWKTAESGASEASRDST